MIKDGFIDYYSKMSNKNTWEVQQKVNQNLSALKNLSFDKLIFTANGEITSEKKIREDLKNQKVTYLQNSPQVNTAEQKIKDIAFFLKFLDDFPGGINHDDIVSVREKLDQLTITSPSMAEDRSYAQLTINEKLMNKTTKPIPEPKIDPASMDAYRFKANIEHILSEEKTKIDDKINTVSQELRKNEKDAKEEVSNTAWTIALTSWGSLIAMSAFPLIGLSVPVLAPLIFLVIPAFVLAIGLTIAYVIVAGKERFENSELTEEYNKLIKDRNILKSEENFLSAIYHSEENINKFIPFCNKYEISSIREALKDPEKTNKLFLIYASEEPSVQESIEDKTNLTKNKDDNFEATPMPSDEEIEQYRKDLNLV